MSRMTIDRPAEAPTCSRSGASAGRAPRRRAAIRRGSPSAPRRGRVGYEHHLRLQHLQDALRIVVGEDWPSGAGGHQRRWAIIKGNALEVELRRRFRQLHPEFQVIDGTDISLVSDAHPVMHASLDGFIYDEASDSWGILEIKTANANRGRTDWHNDEGELIAPDYYMAQVTHYMAVTGFRWGYFYADIGEAERSRCASTRRGRCGRHHPRRRGLLGFRRPREMPALTGADVAKAYPEPAEASRT